MPSVNAVRLHAERERVAAAARRLAAAGLVAGTAGNVSERAGELVAVTPTGAELAGLSAEQITVVDLEGRPVEGRLEPTSELDLHLGVYRRYGSAAVVHTHAPAATAVACVATELPAIHYQVLALGGPVRVAPYATFGSAELAAGVLEALEGRTAALMASHGAVTHGHTLDAAVAGTELLEWLCDVYARAVTLGSPRVLGEDELSDVIRVVARRGYGAVREREP
ncbi:MAG TPA: class II aldolase/adducin family protein [Solirubrobacteraceae bacterium]|nr:class II aldolase/adducin family protein [Solirubrobacteraceae bacterium]